MRRDELARDEAALARQTRLDAMQGLADAAEASLGAEVAEREALEKEAAELERQLGAE